MQDYEQMNLVSCDKHQTKKTNNERCKSWHTVRNVTQNKQRPLDCVRWVVSSRGGGEHLQLLAAVTTAG